MTAGRGIDDWAVSRPGRGRSALPGCWADRELTDEQRAGVVDAYCRGYGVTAIAAWLAEEHDVQSATKARVESYIRREGVKRA